ncbi:MAG: hypothetical protein KBG77_10260 [Dermatophilaceae bacterium]|nr:hypothetical protein [Dermatophilaceae bacterium]
MTSNTTSTPGSTASTGSTGKPLNDRTKVLLAIVASFLGLVLLAKCGAATDDGSAGSTGVETTTAAVPSTTITATPSLTPSPTPTLAPAAESADNALAISTRIIAAQSALAATPGGAGDAGRAEVYIGPALTAANAAAKLQSTLSPEALADLPLKLDNNPVLAISRGTAYPRAMVVRALKAQTGSPVVLVLIATEGDNYRIHNQATLLPSGFSGRFDALAKGSPTPNDGAGLAIAPDALMTEYAGWLAFPRTADAPPASIANDSFSDQLIAAAKAQAASLRGVGTLTQAHAPVGAQLTIALAEDKGALVATVLERTDTYTETTANALTPPKEFSVLTGKTVIDKKATLKSFEFVLFYVPPSGPAQVVAASDQLVAASGS